ncbi:MAG: hypothetical protein KAQ64_02745 [Candidatus Pacebacteria bacterium]|nr:hypothetical protein [Candidatus Paceibacterota bacterium]
MRIEILDKIRKNAPEFVWDGLSEDYATDAIIKIRETYKFEQRHVDMMTDIIGLLALKEINLEQAKDNIQSKFELDERSAKEVSLIILTEIFYPIKDYFPGIEDEILKLGGKIPKEKPKKLTEQLLKREEEMEKMKEREEEEKRERMADTIISKPIEELVKEFPVVGEYQIGSQKAIELKSMPVPMKPLIKFWLKDYKEKMGYYQHSNLERVQYVYRDKNTKNMNEEERRQLNLILKSVDEGIPLPYSTRMKKIDFSKTNEE